MADNIRPAQVPEVQPPELQDILGFDASNNWAKIKGSELTETAATAREALATAQDASAVASSAQTKATGNGVRLDKLTSQLQDVRVIAGTSASVSVGEIINGLKPPTESGRPDMSRALYFPETVQSGLRLTMTGASYLGTLYAGKYGSLYVAARSAPQVEVYDGSRLAGTVVAVDEAPLSFELRVVASDSGSLIYLSCAYNCRWEPGEGDTYIIGPANVDISAVKAVAENAQSAADKALQTAAEAAAGVSELEPPVMSFDSRTREVSSVSNGAVTIPLNGVYNRNVKIPNTFAFTPGPSRVSVSFTSVPSDNFSMDFNFDVMYSGDITVIVGMSGAVFFTATKSTSASTNVKCISFSVRVIRVGDVIYILPIYGYNSAFTVSQEYITLSSDDVEDDAEASPLSETNDTSKEGEDA